MRLVDQALSNTLPLVSNIDGQIGEVAAVGEVGNSSRYAHETADVASGHNKIRVTQHLIKSREIIGGTPLGERRRSQDTSKLLGGQIWLQRKRNWHGLSRISIA
jgi:hypothetical protein